MPCIVNVTHYSGLVDKYSLGSVSSPGGGGTDLERGYGDVRP